jgi:cytochrome oxidase Cu insertion factor (SCO1/SenC/PrrC family)/thiol-disulfide isomerase/thioredoxin
VLRRVRWMLLCAAGIVAVTLAVLVALSNKKGDRSSAATPVPAPFAIGTELPHPKHVPSFPLVDSHGKPFQLHDTHGKWIVLAPSMTLCGEVCPMTTGVLEELKSTFAKDGIGKQVEVVETTVDPWRDSPARLRAYQREFGANFTMVTGSQHEIRKFWDWFGVQYQRVPEGKPADIDWWTHKPLTFDINHTDAVYLIDPHGYLRVANDGMPKLQGKLSPRLRSLLDSEGIGNLEHPHLPWTADQVADDVLNMMGRAVPAGQVTKVTAPSTSDARSELRGSPAALKSLHAQASRLLGSTSALSARLRALRGHPVVLNAWASWCEPCRQEFPYLATAAAAYGRQIGFVGADINDQAENARTFLASHPVSYPSYSTSLSALSPLKVYPDGPPQTIFINAQGHVVFVHNGEYQSLTALENDIGQYSLGIKAADRPNAKLS